MVVASAIFLERQVDDLGEIGAFDDLRDFIVREQDRHGIVLDEFVGLRNWPRRLRG